MTRKKAAEKTRPKAGATELIEEELEEVQGGGETKRPPNSLLTWGSGLPRYKTAAD